MGGELVNLLKSLGIISFLSLLSLFEQSRLPNEEIEMGEWGGSDIRTEIKLTKYTLLKRTK